MSHYRVRVCAAKRGCRSDFKKSSRVTLYSPLPSRRHYKSAETGFSQSRDTLSPTRARAKAYGPSGNGAGSNGGAKELKKAKRKDACTASNARTRYYCPLAAIQGRPVEIELGPSFRTEQTTKAEGSGKSRPRMSKIEERSGELPPGEKRLRSTEGVTRYKSPGITRICNNETGASDFHAHLLFFPDQKLSSRPHLLYSRSLHAYFQYSFSDNLFLPVASKREP